MARRKTEPVKHTCPNIDRMIDSITQIVKAMDNCDERDEKEDLISQIEDWSRELTSIGYGNRCSLEDLRSSNSALREWGHDMYNEAEDLEMEKDKLEQQLAEVEEKNKDLRERIEELKEELAKTREELIEEQFKPFK